MPWLLLLIPAGIAGWFFLAADFTVRRSRLVRAGREEVFAAVRDLQMWPKWSPWLICDPEAKVEFRGESTEVGGSYSWDGEIVGDGEMTLKEIAAPEGLDFAITLRKPFQSTATAKLEFQEVPGGTEVTWSMVGRMPAFLHRSVRAVVSADYERGLKLLEDVVRTGAVRSRLEIHGVVERAGAKWIGVKRECAMRDLALSMQEAFGTLEKRLTEEGILAVGPWMTIYENYDLVKGDCAYVAAAPVGLIPVPEGMASGAQPPHEALAITHFGPYEHLGNPWAAAYQHVRAKGLKLRKRPAPYEVYVKGPDEGDETEICTEIYVPVV